MIRISRSDLASEEGKSIERLLAANKEFYYVALDIKNPDQIDVIIDPGETEPVFAFEPEKVPTIMATLWIKGAVTKALTEYQLTQLQQFTQVSQRLMKSIGEESL